MAKIFRFGLCLAAIILIVSVITEAKRGGGGSRGGSRGGSWGSSSSSWGSRRGSSNSRKSSGSSWFSWGSKKKPKSNPGSYPKQEYKPVSNTGTGVAAGTGVGGGGFIAPKKNNYGQSNAGTGIGGGGFVAPKKNNYGQSNAGTGVGGGGFVAPKQNNYGGSYGQTNAKINYGGNYGSNYGGKGWSNRWKGNRYGYGSSVGSYGYGRPSSLFGGGKKAFGLAVGAGFVGGAVAGIYGMQMYHRYKMYQSMMYYHGHGGYYGGSGYGFRNTRCFGGCPIGSFCDYGMCRCRPDYEDLYGRCWRNQDDFTRRQSDWDKRLSPDFDPFISCTGHSDCLDLDMNMYCSKTTNKCQCRESTKWNKESLECQLFMDVDCRSTRSGAVGNVTDTTTTTTAKPASLSIGSNSTNIEDGDDVVPDIDLGNRTIANLTADDTLVDSGLLAIDLNKTTENDIREQFCYEMKALSQKYTVREIDPYRNDRIGEQAMAIGAGVIAFIVFAVCGFCCCVVFICKKLAGQRKSSGGGNHSHSSSSSDAGKDHEEPPPVGYNPYSGEITTGVPQQQPQQASAILPPVPGQPAVAAAPGYDAPPPYAPVGADGSSVPPYPPQPYPQQGAAAPYPQQGYPAAPYPQQQPAAPYAPVAGAAPYPPAPGAVAPYPPAGAAPYPQQGVASAPYPPAP